MVVLKFGGSSVGQPERFNNAKVIVQRYIAQGDRPVIIASALSGVTDRLVEVSRPGGGADKDIERFLTWMNERHIRHAEAVLGAAARSAFIETLGDYIHLSQTLVRTIHNESAPVAVSAARDELLAVGERLSVYLFARALTEVGIEALPVDAVSLIQTDDTFGAGRVDAEKSYQRIETWYNALPEQVIPVVTGFIGGTCDRKTTTLGRGGSDYSASILAAGIRAQKLERWTDVDGVYTSDPRIDPTAKRLEYVVMEEALSWNKAGKMGLHRKALDPLIEARIPLYVRSIDKPDKSGTIVHPRYQQAIAC